VQPEGRVLHITGQVAWDAEGRGVGEDDCEVQVRKCFDNVESILRAVGGRFEDIVSLMIYFLHHANIPVIQRVRAELISPETAPASVLIRVAGLVDPKLLVEVVPIAVIPEDRYHEPAW